MRSEMKLTEFVKAFCERPFGSLLPPFHCAENVDGVAKYILFREPPFQVELITFWPGGFAVPEHRHPNVDTIQVLLSGDLRFMVDGKTAPWKALDDRLVCKPGFEILKRTVAIRANQSHSAESQRTGATWLSFENWVGTEEIHTTVEDWDGQAFGPKHYHLIKK